MAASSWIMVSGESNDTGLGQGATEFPNVAGSLSPSLSDEDQDQINCAVAYTWQNSGIRVTSNNIDNASTLTARVEAADKTNQQVSITANTTGWFEDTSGTVAISAGELVSWGLVGGAGAGGDELRYTVIAAEFEHASLDRPTLSAGTNRETTSAGDTEFYTPLGGLGNGTGTESAMEYTLRQGVTFSNLRIFVDTHGGGGSAATFDLREDGVSSTNLTISIATGTTGEFEDTDSEAVSTGSDINYRMVAGETIQFTSVQMLMAGAVTGRNLGVGESNAGSHAVGATDYITIEGTPDNISTTESDTQIEMPVAVTVSDLMVRIPANSLSTAATTFALRVNGADSALDLSVSAGSTGAFEDSSSVDLSVDDLVNWELNVASGGTGTITANLIGLEQGQTAAAGLSIPVAMHNYYRQRQWARA